MRPSRRACDRSAGDVLALAWNDLGGDLRAPRSRDSAHASRGHALHLLTRVRLAVNGSESIQDVMGFAGSGVHMTSEKWNSGKLPKGIGSDELLSRMLEISTVGVIFFDPAGDIMLANDTFLRWTGFSREDVDAGLLRWDRLTPPEWMPASLKAIYQLKTNGSTVPYEKEYFRKDGTRFQGLFAAKGLASNCGVEFILDMSEQDQTRALLTKSEERFRQLAECAPIGVFEADLQGNVTYANPLAQKVFGLPEPDLLGHGWLSRLCPEDATRVAAEWPVAIAENRAYDVEYRLAMPDGEVRIICAHSVMLHSPNGEPFGVVGTVEDITARKLAEATPPRGGETGRRREARGLDRA